MLTITATQKSAFIRQLEQRGFVITDIDDIFSALEAAIKESLLSEPLPGVVLGGDGTWIDLKT